LNAFLHPCNTGGATKTSIRHGTVPLRVSAARSRRHI
jgi:hypothetical protein